MVAQRRRQWHPTPVLLPGKSHRRRSLVGCSPWGHEESDMTERLHFHFSLLCIGEGNGNPLQCYCLENPRDGVAQSWTRLKWLSSSSQRGKNLPAVRRLGFYPWLGKIPWRRKWLPISASLPREVQGQRSLVSYSPWGSKELDTTERLTHMHTCIINGRNFNVSKERGKVTSNTFIGVGMQRMLNKIWEI